MILFFKQALSLLPLQKIVLAAAAPASSVKLCNFSTTLTTFANKNMSQGQQKRALVLIAPGSEEIEAVTPIDVLRRAGVHVSVAGLLDNSPVVCSRNVVLVPDGSLTDFVGDGKEVYDVVILPGGLKGAEAFANSPVVGSLLKAQEEGGRLIAAICAAPTALKAHGIGQGKQITSYPSVKEQMTTGTDYTYQEDRVVIDGNLVTSRGPGTALEFALALTEILAGKEKAVEVGKGMLFIGAK